MYIYKGILPASYMCIYNVYMLLGFIYVHHGSHILSSAYIYSLTSCIHIYIYNPYRLPRRLVSFPCAVRNCSAHCTETAAGDIEPEAVCESARCSVTSTALGQQQTRTWFHLVRFGAVQLSIVALTCYAVQSHGVSRVSDNGRAQPGELRFAPHAPNPGWHVFSFQTLIWLGYFWYGQESNEWQSAANHCELSVQDYWSSKPESGSVRMAAKPTRSGERSLRG